MQAYAPALRIELPINDRPKPAGTDPMEIRWAVHTGPRDKMLQGWKAGMSMAPFGQFFAVTRFNTVKEIHSTDDSPEFPREMLVTETADTVEKYLGTVLGGRNSAGDRDMSILDMGIQFGFRGETDYAKMAVISATLLPPLPRIREFVAANKLEDPIGPSCEGQDAADFDDRTDCPACWSKWIRSDACSAYIAHIMATGMIVEEYDPATGETGGRVVAPTNEEFVQGRRMVELALRTSSESMRSIWSQLVIELEKGERKGIDKYQENLRKDVHGVKPADKQMAMMREFGKASQAPAGGADVMAILAGLAQAQADSAASTARTNELLAAVLAKGATKEVLSFANPEDPVDNGDTLPPDGVPPAPPVDGPPETAPPPSTNKKGK